MEVLLSIHPQWCELIASGKKTVEVRKTKPKLAPPFKVYIYQTKHREHNGPTHSDGKVIGEFICDKITQADYGRYCRLPQKETQIEALDLMDYADGKTLYGWHISNLVMYDKPKQCREYVEKPPRSWCYIQKKEDL